jgi:hypothetical protein
MKVLGRALGMKPSSVLGCLLLALITPRAVASQLTVDRRTLTLDDHLTISLVLDGPFTDLGDVAIPLQNLELLGDASSRVEFSWVNGTATYRRTLVYTAKAKTPGVALVGPLVLRGRKGAVETLAPISVQVLPDVGGGTSNDPVTIARELVATQRDPIFIVATADKTEAFVGQAITVTWMLYNATSLQRYGIDDVAHLDDFWVEEIPLQEREPEAVIVGELRMQRVPIRRAVLYPLHSGRLVIGSMSINAEAIRRVGNDRFGIPYEGMLVEINRRSPQIVVNARPIPAGPPVSAVGDVVLQCDALPASATGPVTLRASMSGIANLRSAPAPAFETPLDGSVQVVDAGFSVDRRTDDAMATRRWRYVIFPAHSGRLVVPPLTATILTPAGERRTLRCASQTILTAAGSQPAAAANESTPLAAPTARATRVWPWLAGGLGVLLIAVLAGALAVPRIRRLRARRREVRSILGGSGEPRRSNREGRTSTSDPQKASDVGTATSEPRTADTAARIRDSLNGWLVLRGLDPAALLGEASDRGDALRAALSLLDAAGRDRIVWDAREVRRRLRDVVETCAPDARMAQSR